MEDIKEEEVYLSHTSSFPLWAQFSREKGFSPSQKQKRVLFTDAYLIYIYRDLLVKATYDFLSEIVQFFSRRSAWNLAKSLKNSLVDNSKPLIPY